MTKTNCNGIKIALFMETIRLKYEYSTILIITCIVDLFTPKSCPINTFRLRVQVVGMYFRSYSLFFTSTCLWLSSVNIYVIKIEFVLK